MAGKINQFVHEYMFGISIAIMIIGVIVLILGALGIWTNVLQDSLQISEDIVIWSPYIFGVGIILLLAGVFYLYDHLKNKRFFMEEINTNKRSEFIKRHVELKNAVKHLPKKYQKILTEKEREFKIR